MSIVAGIVIAMGRRQSRRPRDNDDEREDEGA
jgi:hypothetical protein